MLHVSQPSVTKAIKALESELQIVLIDRSQKQIALTPEGQAFLVHAQRILQDIEIAAENMKRFRVEAETIQFGIPPMIEAYLFSDLVTKFKARYPKVSLEVKEYGDSTQVRNRIEDGEFDFGIVMGAKEANGINEMLLLPDQMSLCVDAGHRLAHEPCVRFEQLKNEKFIMQQSHAYQYRGVYRRCIESGFTPDIVLCTTQMKTIKQLVANKLGISILPNFATRMDKKLIKVPLQPVFPVLVCLIWGTNKCLSATERKFIEFMQQYIAADDFRVRFALDKP